MDTSEQYIKMCDCEEIQVLKPKETDPSNKDNFGSWWWGNKHTHTQPYEFEGEHLIWLPRQDQLQEMLNENMNLTVKQVGITNCLYSYDHKEHATSVRILGTLLKMSWEQLWLAFVMKERWNKIWTGTEWVTQKKN